MDTVLFIFPENEALGELLLPQLKAKNGRMELRHFPDGESYVRIAEDVKNKNALLLCSLASPDEKILPLLFACKTLKSLGAARVDLIAPYLAYMRQDKQFHPGEAITSDYFGELLSGYVDGLVTLDPHLHRHPSLSVIYSIPNRVCHATEFISSWIRTNIEKPLLIGPDSESRQWVSEVAKNAGAPFEILQKERKGDRDVEIHIPSQENYQAHTPVLVDDIISTARTMISVVSQLKAAGMKSPVCIGVHGIFAGNAYEELLQAGASGIVTTNSIAHFTNRIDISPLLAAAYKNLSGENFRA